MDNLNNWDLQLNFHKCCVGHIEGDNDTVEKAMFKNKDLSSKKIRELNNQIEKKANSELEDMNVLGYTKKLKIDHGSNVC